MKATPFTENKLTIQNGNINVTEFPAIHTTKGSVTTVEIVCKSNLTTHCIYIVYEKRRSRCPAFDRCTFEQSARNYEAFAIATIRVEGCNIPAITRCEQPITGDELAVGFASKLAQQAIK